MIEQRTARLRIPRIVLLLSVGSLLGSLWFLIASEISQISEIEAENARILPLAWEHFLPKMPAAITFGHVDLTAIGARVDAASYVEFEMSVRPPAANPCQLTRVGAQFVAIIYDGFQHRTVFVPCFGESYTTYDPGWAPAWAPPGFSTTLPVGGHL